jgi:hypothetical protein
MLAKKTVNNQVTLPKEILDLFPGTDSFDVQIENGRIILKPLQPYDLEQVQNKIAELGIMEEDIRDAIVWALAGQTPFAIETPAQFTAVFI